MAGRPAGPRDGEAWTDRDEGVVTEKRPKVSRPPKFKVILFNDDYTPMEFVVGVLEQVFGKGPTEATQLMLQIHQTGMGIGGVYGLQVAETKVATVHQMAESQGYPLRSGTEKE